MKILHAADIHYSRDTQEPALLSLRALYEYGRDNGVDLWVIAGDLFDRAVQNTEASGFPQLVRVIQDMMNLAPIVAVQGTPTHDIAGCYEALRKIQAEHQFVLINAGTPYLLTAEKEILSAEGCEPGTRWSEDDQLLILGCPEPSKEWFLKDKSLGRDEATQAVKDGMRQLLLGFGAARKQYADIPCLFIYHGSVEGASLCNGQVLPAGELAIGREDLAMVGADYYALGHIHKAQQVGDLPAYYSGSAFPVDWGELDQKQFKTITFAPYIDGSPAIVIESIPYPHPPRIKIIGSTSEFLGDANIEGKQTWLVIRDTRENLAGLDGDKLLESLLEYEALPGSRVTFEIIPTETVRAGEIREAKGLKDKLRVYAENSGEKITDGILAKADKLEAAARASGLAAEGLHIRLDRLNLRGAIGVMKGQGKEEIEVDFRQYDPGLLALIGVNGAGKTTLIENCHPFPEMLTRPGKLQDHFCLRDSHRDLYFTDERTGQQYRAYIQVDGQNASGKCEYHLYHDGQPLTDGRKESYENEIAHLFGSLALFQRSAFVAQKTTKGNPDLSEATKGERKALFRELGGLDYLQAYSEGAREEAKEIEQEILTDQGRIQSLEELVAGSAAKDTELMEMVLSRDEQAEDLQKMEASGKQLRAEAELLREKVEANRRVADQLQTTIKRQEDLALQQAELGQKAGEYNEAVKQKDEAEKAVQRADALQFEEDKLNEEKAKIQAEREQKLAEHRDRSAAVNAEEKRLQAAQRTVDAEIAKNRAKKAGFLAKIDQIQAFLQQQIECPRCRHRFVPGGEEQFQELESLQSQLWDIDKEFAEEERRAAELQDQIGRLEYPPEPELRGFIGIEAQLAAIRKEKATLAGWRVILQKAQEAAVRLEELEKRRQQIIDEQARVKADIEDLQKQIDETIDQRFREKQTALEEAQEAYHAVSKTLSALEASIAALEKQIDELGQKAGELLKLKTAVADKQQDAAEWRWLERACGPDGIQALELDAMGPGVAEIANRLLKAAYGSRFQVEFRTTRMGGQGSKRKQIEDFQIIVLDGKDGSEQPMEMLSGGESVWIKRAIYDAFGIVRDQNTGQRFLTVFQDEADGALDPEARIAYFWMLQAAHQESGRHHTIIITHSFEAQEMVSQRIVMGELAAPVKEAI